MLGSRIAWDRKMSALLPELSCAFSWSDRDGAAVLMLPQCPPLACLLINELPVKWRHIAPRRATRVFFCSARNSFFFAYNRINSHQTLHHGWLHFHINYCCYGNCPKEVITQVVIVTMAIWQWAECSSSDDFRVEAENIVLFFFSTYALSATIKPVFYCRLSVIVQTLKSSSCIVQQPVVNRSILRSTAAAFTLIHTHTHSRYRLAFQFTCEDRLCH